MKLPSLCIPPPLHTDKVQNLFKRLHFWSNFLSGVAKAELKSLSPSLLVVQVTVAYISKITKKKLVCDKYTLIWLLYCNKIVVVGLWNPAFLLFVVVRCTSKKTSSLFLGKNFCWHQWMSQASMQLRVRCCVPVSLRWNNAYNPVTLEPKQRECTSNKNSL